jgi:hypothetical protein
MHDIESLNLSVLQQGVYIRVVHVWAFFVCHTLHNGGAPPFFVFVVRFDAQWRDDFAPTFPANSQFTIRPLNHILCLSCWLSASPSLFPPSAEGSYWFLCKGPLLPHSHRHCSVLVLVDFL